jgi:hypothetical protein
MQLNFQVLAATQRPGLEGKRWFQGTADAVRQFDWLFDVCFLLVCEIYTRCLAFHQTGWYKNESGSIVVSNAQRH